MSKRNSTVIRYPNPFTVGTAVAKLLDHGPYIDKPG
jgi:hypothetical protein